MIAVPPYWIHEPQDSKVILRGSHILRCEADGVPTPNIKWYRGKLSVIPGKLVIVWYLNHASLIFTDSGLMKQPVSNDHKFELLDNGGLKLDNIEAMDASNYTCVVQNGIGTNLVKTIYLQVNSKDLVLKVIIASKIAR